MLALIQVQVPSSLILLKAVVFRVSVLVDDPKEGHLILWMGLRDHHPKEESLLPCCPVLKSFADRMSNERFLFLSRHIRLVPNQSFQLFP